MKKHLRLIAAIATVILCLSCFTGCSYYGSPEAIAEKAFQASFIDFDALSLSECIPDDAWERMVSGHGYADKDKALIALQDALYENAERILESTDHSAYTIDYKITRVDNFTQAETEELDDKLKKYLYSNIEAAAKVNIEYTISSEGNNPFLYWNFSVGNSFVIPTAESYERTASITVFKYNGKWYIDPRIINEKL